MSQIRTNSIVPSGGVPAGASGGGIIQIVSATLNTVFTSGSVASGGDVAVTGLSVSITPRSTSNKIYIFGHLNNSASGNASYALLYKNGSKLTGANGAASGSKTPVHGASWSSNDAYTDGIPINYLDSPATTSSITYQIYAGHSSGSSRTIVVNRGTTDFNAIWQGLTVSTITAMEISG